MAHAAMYQPTTREVMQCNAQGPGPPQCCVEYEGCKHGDWIPQTRRMIVVITLDCSHRRG
ncbi:hypothetical protein BJ165DRAFT_1508968, partial [Panaeolus papilionaceus]